MYGKFQEHLQQELKDIKDAGLYKEERLIEGPQQAAIQVKGKEVLNFCANNYLGLSNNPRLIKAAKDMMDRRGYGMSSVRFICGTQDVHKELEAAISKFFKTEDTILYAACFDANGGVFEPLLTADDAIISDALNHASIIDGVRLCKAKRYRYANADMEDLERQLQAAQEQRFRIIVTDGVFSMDGNVAPIDKICDLAEKYDSWCSFGPLYRLNKPDMRQKEFAWLESMGVKGIKVDFFSQDSISTMNYFVDILEDAAKYHLMVNFHGAPIPRGWQRTYPHMMSVEGVYGAEWYNNKETLTDSAAWHNCTLPFTRNVVGPMDYTPCTFTDSQHPHITSNGHELALLVAFESALQHLADRPEGYHAQPAEIRSFISSLPTVWDDTKLLSGYPSSYVVLARKSGACWYIAGLNGTNEKKSLVVDLSFIQEPVKEITLYADGEERNQFDIQMLSGLKKAVHEVDCLPRGGFVMKVSLD